MSKQRLDTLMVQRGMAESRNMAQRLIMAGEVLVDGELRWKSSDLILEEAQITIKQKPRYVSRGGEKLEEALIKFGFQDLSKLICVDMGASTGGFTDCLLQHGAAKVYAVDVGQGILHWKVRQDQRVVVMEKTNARFLKPFQDKIDLITIDASFISAKILLPVARSLLQGDEGDVILLVKPQFEAGRKETARGNGVIKDPAIHKKVLEGILENAVQNGFFPKSLVPSPLLGPKGNREFLLHLGIKKIGSAKYSDLLSQIIQTTEMGSQDK